MNSLKCERQQQKLNLAFSPSICALERHQSTSVQRLHFETSSAYGRIALWPWRVNNGENISLNCLLTRVYFKWANMDFNTEKSIMNVHTYCTSPLAGTFFYISSWVWRTTACHIKSRRLACFRNSIHKMSKPNRGFIRLLLGTSATITVRDEGPLFLSFAFFPVRHRACAVIIT